MVAIRYKTRNNAVQRHIVDPNNCMCTYRKLQSKTLAIAYVNGTTTEHARVSWRHYPNRTVITWKLDIGVKFDEVFAATATDAEIDAVITRGFERMDEAHKTDTEE